MILIRELIVVILCASHRRLRLRGLIGDGRRIARCHTRGGIGRPGTFEAITLRDTTGVSMSMSGDGLIRRGQRRQRLLLEGEDGGLLWCAAHTRARADGQDGGVVLLAPDGLGDGDGGGLEVLGGERGDGVGGQCCRVWHCRQSVVDDGDDTRRPRFCFPPSPANSVRSGRVLPV